MTEYEYNADGLVTSVTRKDGAETLASVSVAYDESARPVLVRDQDGRVTAFDRDAFGRVLKEKFADGSEVGYTYDAFGRRTSVLDENGHKIAFDWNRFGLSSRTTAENQLTDYVRDDDGLVTEILSKQNGRTDRSIRNEYDEYGRLVYVDYGKGETEKFAYDKWGRIASHTRGKMKETYAYDHFGRLVEKKEALSSTTTSTSFTYDAWGNRTARVTRNRKGEIVSKENRVYDKYGRLAETIAGFGAKVTYAYDSKGRLARQIVDGSPIEFVYTKLGQLAGKYLGGKLNPDAAVEYEYAKSGRIVARTANGVRQTYEYDGRGQLLAVKEGDADVERYSYDKAGNMLKKTIRGKTTTFTFDGANQLVSSTTDGLTTQYAYDAAGRLVKEGDRTYRYGYLDKVLSVTEGERKYTYDYHVDGQLARADYGNDAGNGGRALTPSAPPAGAEDFLWDGLALIRRGDECFVNEPHVGGGNPVVSSKGTTYLNDLLGTTVGIWEGCASSRPKSGRKYTPAALTAFGETIENGVIRSTPTPSTYTSFYTGKPHVAGLGHAFLMRNYRAGLAKWQTADPLGYPDGWNRLAYCGNGVASAVDLYGCWVADVHHDINTTWLENNGIDLHNYKWGMWKLDVLSEMNAGSDWTDSIVEGSGILGNQRDSVAYYHAMRSRSQTIKEARIAWQDYLSRTMNEAIELSNIARKYYARGNCVSARQYELLAIQYLGRLVHSFADSFAPPHSGFQHFDLFYMPAHHYLETMDKYEEWGYREQVRDELNRMYLSTLREVLKQPE